MEFEQFDLSLLKIIGVYGDKSYPQERRRILYEDLKTVSSSAFRDACHYLIATSRQAPMLQDFKSAVEFVSRNDATKQMHRNNCDNCDCYGAIVRFDLSDAMYAFRCECEAGNKNFSGLPSWKSFPQKQFYKNERGLSLVL